MKNQKILLSHTQNHSDIQKATILLNKRKISRADSDLKVSKTMDESVSLAIKTTRDHLQKL